MAAAPVRNAPHAATGIGRPADVAVARRVAAAVAFRTTPQASREHQPVSQFPELDCVRSTLAPDVIAAIERRAAVFGVGAERVLIAAGIFTEEDYVAALARHIGAPFEMLDDLPRDSCPVSDEALLHAPATGMLLFEEDGECVAVVAPQNQAARRFCLAGNVSRMPCRVRLTTSARIQRFVEKHAGAAWAHKAANDLKSRHPNNSAALRLFRPRPLVVVTACAIIAATLLAPRIADAVAAIFVSLVFLAWTALRIAASALPDRIAGADRPVPDNELPDYTIIVALYRESAVVRRLIASLDALDYPREKLDIRIVIEPDDEPTRSALAAVKLDPAYHIVVAPPGEPRTKPKALNAALPFARGTLTAVFDAEDRPDPDQLRLVAARFHDGGERLACVQARLTIDNSADSWLARFFTAEYCGQFDVLLPALAHWQLPLPLGGSSNHFRTDALRKAGAWDPYNVTEDADLGMRLARLGYVTTVIDSSTYEEAPDEVGPWIRQRTRWLKGWMQTWLVHMREPMTLLSEMGWLGFLTFQIVVGGTALSALVHPIFIAVALVRLATGTLLANDGAIVSEIMIVLYGMIFVAGYVATAALAFVGLARRNLLQHAHALLMVPVLWLMLSAAAWRALFQLFRAPYHWDKTEHGLARTSRQRRKNIWVTRPSSSPESAFG